MHFRSLLLPILALCGLAASADAGRLIAIDSNRTIYEIDPATGIKTAIGTASSNAGTTAGLARDPLSGTIYLTSTSNDSLYTLDITTGNATLVGFYGDSTIVMHGLEWDSTQNKLWGGSAGNLFDINVTTGVATQVGATGLTSFLNLGYDPTTDTLYASNSSTDSLYTIHRATGAATLIGPLGPASTNPHGFAFDTDVGVMYMIDSSTDNLCTIDLATGVANIVGSTGTGNLLGLVSVPNPAPPHVSFCFGDGTGTACPCGNSGIAGNGCANSLNANGGNLAATGSASIGNDTLSLQGSGMPNSSALYFQGTSQIVGGTAFGDGLRCAGGSIVRLGTKLNAVGASQYPQGGDQTISVRGLCVAGDVRTYQAWYRNAAAFCTPSTFNLTNGVVVSWLP